MEEIRECAEHELHADRIKRAGEAMPREDDLFCLADLYKLFGDSTRLRILCELRETELCVCDLAAVCGMTVSAISHQLRLLKQARLVKSRREGKSMFYSLADAHVQSILACGMEHINE